MYNEECRREINNFFAQLNRRRNNLPSELAIFNLLETFSYERSRIGESVETTREELFNYAFSVSRQNKAYLMKKFSEEYRNEVELIDKKHSDTVTENYRYVEYNNLVMRKKEHNGVEYDDLIWLHFSILPENLKSVGEELIKILNSYSISFHMRVPNVVGPDAILLGVYNQYEANMVLEACKNNQVIQDSITLNNPFMPHRNGIGIVKETKTRSYNRHLSSLLYEYAKTATSKELSFNGFCRYVLKIFEDEKENRTYQERQLDYSVVLGVFCISKNKDYIDNLVHLPRLVYNKEEFDNYRVTYENGEYHYSSHEKEVSSDDYFEWLKLQAFNCIQRMYYVQQRKLPEEDIKIDEKITGYISSLIDTIMRSEPFQCTSNYRDAMINDLYPYLVGYFAHEAKMTTEEEIKNIVMKVKNRMVTKLQVNGDNKNFYQIGSKTIQSTIPPIRVDNALIGIEYLDYEINYCNVFIYYDDNVKGHLGLFLDTEKDKIWEENDIEASKYRASVARALCQYDSLEKEVIVRGVHEGILVNLPNSTYAQQQTLEEEPPKTII